jgi:hypothetical protein
MPFEPRGRRMGKWVVVPLSLMKRGDQLESWLKQAYRYVRTWPPK